MKNSKIEEHIIKANNSRLRYISLITLGFAVFYLISDFLVRGVWKNESLNIYKVLDIVFTIISVSAVCFFWLFKTKNNILRKACTLLFPFLFLIWSAIITGVDFDIFGFSTLIAIVLAATFFLYINLLFSIVYFVSSGLVLITTLYILGNINDQSLSLILVLTPIIAISIIISAKNYKNKRKDLINNEKMAEMNMKLQYSNQKLEIEIEKRTQDIRSALEKAKESDRLKSVFLANMSHEIRTPMNGILGFAELLQEPDLTSEEQQKYIRIIEKSGERMLNIINNLMDISKIESGHMEVSLSPVNINELLDSTYTFFKPEAERKKIQLFIKKSLSAADVTIKTDKEKVYAILTNLVNNAIKFSIEGSIEFGYEKMGEYYEFYVKDTGIGIPVNRIRTIFDRFVQGDILDKQVMGGAGLGLSIAKAYTEMLGGKIWIDSEVGVGSVFYFTIPCI